VIRSASVLFVLLAVACSVRHPHGTAPSAAEPSSVSDKPVGMEILRNDCLACHTEDLMRQQRLTDKQWVKVIEKMHNWGAPTEPENVGALTSYLASTYTRDSGPFVPEVLSSEKAAALFEPLPDGPLAGGERERGRVLYRERCLPCHGEDGRGGPDGVNLVGRHVLDRAAEFAETVRTQRGRMPAFVETTDGEVADLLTYLRSLLYR